MSYTDTDVELVARTLEDEISAASTWGEAKDAARAVLSALAAAGRLTPAGGETRTEWGWLSVDGSRTYASPSEQAARRAAATSGARTLMRRTLGPWLPVPTDPPAPTP